MGALTSIDLLAADADFLPLGAQEFADRVRNRWGDCPVVFTSCYPCTAKAIGDELGSRAIIEKPFTPAQLRVAVRKQLRRTGSKLLSMSMS